MSGIDTTKQAGGLRPGAASPTTPPPARAAGAAPAVTPPGDRATAGLEALVVRMGPPYARLLAATRANDAVAARAAADELQPLVEAARKLAAGTRFEAAVAKVDAAAQAVEAKLPAAAQAPTAPVERQRVLVGLPGRGGRVVEVERPAPAEHRGPLGFLGRAMGAVGRALGVAGKVVFFPLTLAGKLLDPVTKWTGEALGGLKRAIDGSIGQIPVVGQAVRFTTGLAASLVGLVGGAIHGVTHPMELLEGLGRMAWTAVGMVPGMRTLWDVAVEGKTVGQSLGDSWGEAKALGAAFFEGAITDFKAGNWSGALGRLTGDIGSFFVTGGAAGGAKVAAVGGTVGRAGRLARVAKVARVARLDKVARVGMKAIEVANHAGAKILVGGLRGNFVAWKGAGRLARHLPGGQRVVQLGEATAARLRASHPAPTAARPTPGASPAAVMERPKVASTIPAEALAGEVKLAAPLSQEAAIARQADVLADLERSGPLYEALPDRVIGGLIDSEAKIMEAVKGLKLDGKPVRSMEEAAKAWKQLPADSPVRAAVAKQLAGAIQKGAQEGLGFPPAAVEFRALPENLAGMETRGKVLVDPAILGEDLDFVVHVLAEEQAHAYQRFLVDNQASLKLPKRLGEQVDRFARDFANETYVYPPSKALATFHDDLQRLSKGAADHADEIDYSAARRRVFQDMPVGSPERAVADKWWAAVGDESKRLSFMKYASAQLDLAIKEGTTRIWHSDYSIRRLPRELLEREGRALTPAESQAAFKKAIAESQARLRAANAEAGKLFTEWDAAYRNQALEFVAKNTADDVARWIMAQGS